jgi:hypothetical protein
MSCIAAVPIVHALHEWTEPNSLGVYPFLPHDIVRSITELALINQREVWFDKRNRERDMEIYALSASPKARSFCRRCRCTLSAPIFAWVREEALMWNRRTNSWVRRRERRPHPAHGDGYGALQSYHNEWEFPNHDGGFWEISDNMSNINNSICMWMSNYRDGLIPFRLTTPHKYMHRAFLLAGFNNDIYAD